MFKNILLEHYNASISVNTLQASLNIADSKLIKLWHWTNTGAPRGV